MNGNEEINVEDIEKLYKFAIDNLYACRTKDSIEIAVNYLKQLAERGYIPAQKKLGESYEYGLFTDQDYNEAFYYYNKSARQGDADSQFKVGSFFWNGKGTRKNYEQALSYFIEAAENGSDIAQYQVGFMYQNGIGTNIDYEKALEYLQKQANKGNKDAIRQIGYLYLYGNGVKQDFFKAKELFNKSVKSIKSKDSHIRYYTKLFNEINCKKIQTIENITEPINSSATAVLIKPKKNIDEFSHTLYDINTFNRIKRVSDELLSNIEDVKQDKSNEFEVFQKICEMVAVHVSYDNEAINDYSEKRYISRNLIGALLHGRCICSGDAEKLRNLCAIKDIECIVVHTGEHSFNQVKIQGKWYFIDITQNRYNIRQNGKIDSLLQSEQDFMRDNPLHEPLKGQFTYPSLENYLKKSNIMNLTNNNPTEEEIIH